MGVLKHLLGPSLLILLCLHMGTGEAIPSPRQYSGMQSPLLSATAPGQLMQAIMAEMLASQLVFDEITYLTPVSIPKLKHTHKS